MDRENIEGGETGADNLKSFIDGLNSLHEKGSLTKESYKKLIDENEISSADLTRLDDIAYKHIFRARNALAEGKIETATAELERASVLIPFDTVPLIELAEVYIRRYNTRGYLKRDFLRAESSVLRALAINPRDRKALDIKREMDASREIFKGKSPNRKFLPLALVLLAIIVLAVFSRKDFILPRFLPGSKKSQSTETVTEMPTEQTGRSRQFAVDVNTANLNNTDLKINILKSEISTREGLYVFTLLGEVIPQTQEITKLNLEISWDGSPAVKKQIPVIGPGDPPARPGDTVPVDAFFHLTRVPEDPENAVISTAGMTTEPPGHGPQPERKSVREPRPLPEGTALDISVREISVLEGYDKMYYTILFEAENNGYNPLNGLDLDLEWHKGADNPVYRETVNVTSPGGVPFNPKTRRPLKATFTVPSDMTLDGAELYFAVRNAE